MSPDLFQKSNILSKVLDEGERRTIVPTPKHTQYVVAVLVMATLGAFSAVVISIARPNTDNTMLIASIFGFLAPTTLSLLALMKAQETHLSVNSRLDQFLRNATMLAHSQGEAIGRKQGKEEADNRADKLNEMR